jgi:hypothetical protein
VRHPWLDDRAMLQVVGTLHARPGHHRSAWTIAELLNEFGAAWQAIEVPSAPPQPPTYRNVVLLKTAAPFNIAGNGKKRLA